MNLIVTSFACYALLSIIRFRILSEKVALSVLNITSTVQFLYVGFDIQAGIQSTFDDIEDLMDLCHKKNDGAFLAN